MRIVSIMAAVLALISVVSYSLVGQVFAADEPAVFWQHKTNGLYGGVVQELAILPTGEILAGTYGAGIFRSSNNGDTWMQAPYEWPFSFINSLAVNALGQAFAGSWGLFRSDDGGQSWVQTGLAYTNVNSIAFDTWNCIYVTTLEQGVLRSKDNGQSWTPINNGLPAGPPYGIENIAINSSGQLFGSSYDYGIFRSIDNGENWIQINNGLTDTRATSIVLDSSGNLFAGTYDQGVFCSMDNGDNWTPTSLSSGWIYSLAVSSSDTVYAGIWRGGVARSNDAGFTWVSTGPENTAIRSILVTLSGDVFAGSDGEGIFRSTDNGDSWLKVNNGLTNAWVRAVSTNSSGDVFAATWNNGIYRSSDNGETWVCLGLTKKVFDSLGLGSTDNVFAGTGDIFRSTDNGETWMQMTFGLTNLLQNFAVNSLGHIFAATQNGMFRSTDGGATWTQINNGLSGTNIKALAVNNRDHVFVGVWGGEGGVFRSTDNGETWNVVGLSGINIRSIASDSLGNIFVGTGLGEGVYRSADDGETWQAIGLTSFDCYCLLIDPLDNVYVGTIGSGVYRSDDHGNSWTHVEKGLTDSNVLSLTVNANGYIFAGTQSGVFRSSVTIIHHAKHMINDYIQDLPDTSFKGSADQLKTAFANKFDAIDSILDIKNYNGAIEKLKNDIRAKADGSIDGNPTNDWIIDPLAQRTICSMIDHLMDYLMTLMK
jgi:photosystem II stability/assembly factor-like uncharacterized protein